MNSGLRFPPQVNEAGFDVAAEGKGFVADIEGIEQEVECRVDLRLGAANPDEDIRARAALQSAEPKVDLLMLNIAASTAPRSSQPRSMLNRSRTARPSNDGDRPATSRKR
ncbi:hypothetical protein [Streptomyces sp. NPDC102487]|uniref:hypothetical protein n=1 Tax=Streptomyces sp. NPDC102487 TaxID=3366182 RepID=UPI00380A0390